MEENRYKKIKVYDRWKLKPKIKNKLDFLWWSLHILDKVSEEKALKILEEIDHLLENTNDKDLLYWFLRFLKDNNLFNLSSKIKIKMKKLIKKYITKFENLYNNEENIFEKYMTKEPLEIIKKYW